MTVATPQKPSPGRPDVVIATLGSAGDMYPFLRIGRTLMSRGHRVTMLGPGAHTAMAAAAGVPFHRLGTKAQYQAMLEHPDLWDSRKGFAVLWSGMRDFLPHIANLVAKLSAYERCVLLAHPLAVPMVALARAIRPELRIITGWLAPANLRSILDPLTIGSMHIPPSIPYAVRRCLWRWIDARFIDRVALPDLNRTRQGLGLPPVRHFIDALQQDSDASITLFPDWFARTQPDWPQPLAEGEFQLFEPQGEDAPNAELERFLAAGTAPIVFTPGSANQQAARYFERALDATRRLGQRAIFLTPHHAQVPRNLPPELLWMPYSPLHSLLPRVGAIVHHGGIGTTAEALRAGIPQLIVPMAYDQFDNGARVRALNVGRSVATWRARPRKLASLLMHLLTSPEIQAACRATAQRLSKAQPDRVCDLIEQML